jgi:hypothetical protein
LWCFVGEWVGGLKPGICPNNLGKFLLPNPDFFFEKAVPVPFFGGGFYDLFFSQLFFYSNFFFNPRGISVEAFSGVENAKTWGSSPEMPMPKIGSPLAKGGLAGN